MDPKTFLRQLLIARLKVPQGLDLIIVIIPDITGLIPRLKAHPVGISFGGGMKPG